MEILATRSTDAATDPGQAIVAHLVDRRCLAVKARGTAALRGLDRLEPGEVLVLLDDGEPCQLTELLVALGYDVESRLVGETWRSIVRSPRISS